MDEVTRAAMGRLFALAESRKTGVAGRFMPDDGVSARLAERGIVENVDEADFFRFRRVVIPYGGISLRQRRDWEERGYPLEDFSAPQVRRAQVALGLLADRRSAGFGDRQTRRCGKPRTGRWQSRNQNPGRHHRHRAPGVCTGLRGGVSNDPLAAARCLARPTVAVPVSRRPGDLSGYGFTVDGHAGGSLGKTAGHLRHAW